MLGSRRRNRYQPLSEEAYPSELLYATSVPSDPSNPYHATVSVPKKRKTRKVHKAVTNMTMMKSEPIANRWDICDNVPVPDNCERCGKWVPQIRALDKSVGTLEFMCYPCRDMDPKLRNLPVKPKTRKVNNGYYY